MCAKTHTNRKCIKWLFAARISQAQFHEYVASFNKTKTIYTNDASVSLGYKCISPIKRNN